MNQNEIATPRTVWTDAVAAAEIVAAPYKVVRHNTLARSTSTFWELALTVNGQPIENDQAFRYHYKTRKEALVQADAAVAEIRETLGTVEFYFESQDFPDTDYVKAVLS